MKKKILWVLVSCSLLYAQNNINTASSMEKELLSQIRLPVSYALYQTRIDH